ncbi:hypothetical protein Tsubulata_039368 [Turnera subulata]|uniref:U-box domain-containing protein n=1 Tax=Turnera subulata TaxID=218843 RepID=A0A9Q0J7L1_9ROSI|nr:hypothetical protein Tsubulata_047389 [Turnera subulata]KAJ4831062.1 hypothetical protein Tsubulata_039368 [Turnera subulata]
MSRWRWRKAARKAKQLQLGENKGGVELVIPNNFRCPISLDLMKDPVTMSSGITYDRQSIERWIEDGNVTCPLTHQVLRSLEPIPNHTLRRMIQEWCVQNRSHGIERIPTPRVPVSPDQVSDILSKIATATKRKDQVGCQNFVGKIKALAKESDRNKKCIAANGAARVLSLAFEEFSSSKATSFEKNNVAVLAEILSCLALMFPLGVDARDNLGSVSSMTAIVWFLKGGDFTSRREAVLVLRELVSMDHRKAEMLPEIAGAMEGLFAVVKEPVSATATKAALVVIYYMVASSNSSSSPANMKSIARFVDMGLVPLLLELMVDADRSTCEKVLGILDGICSSDRGREEAYNHALSIPVLVRKIHRSSDLAIDFSVSILWKLCKNEKREDGGVVVEALQRSAFQKLLLLLQVGCGERTKEKATELLKLLNSHRSRAECIDSMDFKNLKRTFDSK